MFSDAILMSEEMKHPMVPQVHDACVQVRGTIDTELRMNWLMIFLSRHQDSGSKQRDLSLVEIEDGYPRWYLYVRDEING